MCVPLHSSRSPSQVLAHRLWSGRQPAKMMSISGLPPQRPVCRQLECRKGRLNLQANRSGAAAMVSFVHDECSSLILPAS